MLFRSEVGMGTADLAAIARGAGIQRVAKVSTPFDFIEAVADAFEDGELSVVVARVEAVGPDHFGMDLHLPENMFQFERYIREKR